MKKKVLMIMVLMMVFSLFSVTVLADADVDELENLEFKAGQNSDKMVGIGVPNFAWARKNDEGLIEGYRGFNLALGYSQKNYFEAGLEEGEFNNYWGFGTIILILPYVEVGTDYVFAADEDRFWSAGGALGLYSLIPSPRFNISYHF